MKKHENGRLWDTLVPPWGPTAGATFQLVKWARKIHGTYREPIWAVLYIAYLPTDHGRRDFSEINIKNMIFMKILIFQKLVKIGSWGGFGPILDPDSNSARRTVYITWFKSIFHRFLKIRLLNFAIFRLPSYISAYFDISIRRALKKHAYCLIFRNFGWS